MAVKPDDAQNETSKDSSSGILTSLIRSRVTRVNGLNAKGLAASSIGIVLAASIGLGYLAGSWLDNKFGTTYWTPVMLLLGVGAGFREFFHIIQSLNKEAARDVAEKRKKREQESGAGTTRPKGMTVMPEQDREYKSQEPARSFRIPAPPLASFDTDKVGDKPSTAVTQEAPEDVDDISTLTERLLKENDDKTPSS